MIMGMHLYDIYILYNEVSLNTYKGTWNLNGVSNVSLEEASYQLVNSSLLIRKINTFKFILNKCIEIEILHDNQMVKGYKLSGCFSCFKYGIEQCYNFVNFVSKKNNIYINILGHNVLFRKFDEFEQAINKLYNEKYMFFKRGHPKFDYIIPPSKYYKKLTIYQIKMKILSIINK